VKIVNKQFVHFETNLLFCWVNITLGKINKTHILYVFIGLKQIVFKVENLPSKVDAKFDFFATLLEKLTAFKKL